MEQTYRRDRWLGIALTLISGLAFSILPIFNRLATAAGANLVTVLGLRFSIAAVVVWLLLLRRPRVAMPRPRAIGLMLMGALYVLQSSCFFISSIRIPVAVTSILLYLYPAFVTVLAWAFLKEKLSARQAVSLALALGGCVLTLGAPQVGGDWVGIGFGVLSAVLYSIYIVLGARLQVGIPALTASGYIMASAGAIFLLFGGATGQFNFALDLQAWLSILGLALVCTVVAVMLFLAGIKYVGPSQASIISTVEPVGTALLGALLLSEGLGLLQILGGALVIAAVVLLSTRRSKDHTTEIIEPTETHL
jgi:drug/metabolite transporter (DMT)-like permease